MNENWIVFKSSRKQSNRSAWLRYGVAVLLAGLAAVITDLRPSLTEMPHFIFLGAVVFSALYGGLGPAFATAGLSTILVQVLFVHSFSAMIFSGSLERVECMALFMLSSLMIGCFVSALRVERNLLKESEARYRVLAESSSDAILVIDDRGEILCVNPVAEQIFGATAPHIMGQNIARLLPHSIYQPYLGEETPRLNNAVAFELPDKRAIDKFMLVEMTLSACSRHGRRLYAAIIRDITGLPRTAAPAELSI